MLRLPLQQIGLEKAEKIQEIIQELMTVVKKKKDIEMQRCGLECAQGINQNMIWSLTKWKLRNIRNHVIYLRDM